MPVPPDYMQANATQGLDWHEAGFSGDGIEESTIERAKAIAAGEDMTDEHVQDMAAWFARHESSIEGVELDPDNPTPGWVAWHLWGGDETNRAQEWAAAYVAELEGDDGDDDGDGDRENDVPDAGDGDGDGDRRATIRARFVAADERDGVYWRHYAIRAEDMQGAGKIQLQSSTDAMIDMGGFREKLVHEPDAVDVSAAHSLLYNHNADYLLGGASQHRIEGGALLTEAEVMPDARLPSGVSAQEAIERGFLRGVSIGYTYSEKDCDFDEAERSVVVRKWRLLETTFTPIPADPDAGVRSRRSLPFHPARSANQKESDMTDGNKPNQPGTDTAAIEKKAREAARKEAREVVEFAARYGVPADDVVGMSMAEAKEHVLTQLAERVSSEPSQPPVTIVTADAGDKAIRAADNYLLSKCRFAKPDNGNPLVGRGIREAGVRWAEMQGVRNARDWSRRDQAAFALGDYRNMSRRAARDAANITTASFNSFVNLNTLTKIVAAGFEQGGSSINYELFTDRQTVPDFKQYSIGSLGTGALEKVAENVALPELSKSEGVYNGKVKLWGGTLSLSIQALINDDTNMFERSLKQAGAIAQKTINKRVYQKLLMGTSSDEDTSTWTNNTTTGDIQHTTADGAVSARAKLDDVIAALMTKTGQDGEPLGTTPAFLLVAPGLAGQARGLVGGLAPGQTTVHQPAAGDLQVIMSPYLTTGSGLTGADSAHYYLLADPNEVTTLMVNFITGMETPQVMEYDAGATVARNWKIFQFFEADLVYQANSAGTDIIAGAQQGTD